MSHKKTYQNAKVISREEARVAGESRYFTGLPCKKGHISPRMVNKNRCVMCRNGQALACNNKRRDRDPELAKQKARDYKHENMAAAIFRNVRSRARKRNILFTITVSDVVVPRDCPCCGIEMKMRSGPAKQGAVPTSPSLDRFNPRLGYHPGNVVVICWRCNNLKRDASVQELEVIVNWMRFMSEKRLLTIAA